MCVCDPFKLKSLGVKKLPWSLNIKKKMLSIFEANNFT